MKVSVEEPGPSSSTLIHPRKCVKSSRVITKQRKKKTGFNLKKKEPKVLFPIRLPTLKSTPIPGSESESKICKDCGDSSLVWLFVNYDADTGDALTFPICFNFNCLSMNNYEGALVVNEAETEAQVRNNFPSDKMGSTFGPLPEEMKRVPRNAEEFKIQSEYFKKMTDEMKEWGKYLKERPYYSTPPINIQGPSFKKMIEDGEVIEKIAAKEPRKKK